MNIPQIPTILTAFARLQIVKYYKIKPSTLLASRTLLLTTSSSNDCAPIDELVEGTFIIEDKQP